MSTDFFDHDLRVDHRTPARAPDDGGEPVRDTISSRAISRLVEQKQERTTQVAGAVQEMELMRLRQRELEQEKDKLEALTRKQESYEQAKRSTAEQLERASVLFDKQAADALRAAEVLSTIRKQFEDCLQEIQQIDENRWGTDAFEVELNKAIAIVDHAQTQYKQGVSKVNAVSLTKSAPAEIEPASLLSPKPESFVTWVKMGLAFSLPLMMVVVVCFLVWLLLSGVLGGRP